MIKEFDKTKTFWMLMAVSLIGAIVRIVLFPIFENEKVDWGDLLDNVLFIVFSSLTYLVLFFLVFKTNLKNKIKDTTLFLNLMAIVVILIVFIVIVIL